MAQNDYSAFAEAVVPSGQELSQLVSLVHQMEEAELAMVAAEEEFKRRQDQYVALSQHEIPTLMLQIGMSEFSLGDGRKVSVGSQIRCSVPKANLDKAMEWLDEHGHGALIKRQLLIAFERANEEEAKRLVDELFQREYDVKQLRKVEPQTLKAHIKEQLAAGVNFPMELFGAYEQKFTKIGQYKKRS